MQRRTVSVVLLCFILGIPLFGQRGIPAQADTWQIEVSSPGNEYYDYHLPEPPSEQSSEEFRGELESLLGKYRDRFNVQQQIARLHSGEGHETNSFRFVVMGDSRSNEDVWFNMVKHISQLDPMPKFIINTGDLVRKGYAHEYHDYLLPPLLKTEIPFFPAIGNHDDGEDAKARQYRYLFGENSLNYYFDYGGIRFICMDNVTRVYSSDKADKTYERTLQWLESVLSKTPRHRQIYVFAHRPPGNIAKWMYHAWDLEYSQVFTNLMTRYEVDHVYLGHIHAYSTVLLNGVPYTVTGGGGAPMHDYYGTRGNRHHYIICDRRSNGTVEQRVVWFRPGEKGT